MSSDPVAFATFVDEHFDAVARTLTAGLRRPRLAREVTEEAFARAHAQWTRRNGAAPTVTSLYVEASRIALRRPRTEPVAPPTTEPDTLDRAIEELPERERLALVLHHCAALNRDDLARAFHTSPSDASATLRTAYRLLGVDHDDDDDIPEVELDAP